MVKRVTSQSSAGTKEIEMRSQSLSGKNLHPIESLETWADLLVNKFDIYYQKYPLESTREYRKQSDMQKRIREFSKKDPILGLIFAEVSSENIAVRDAIRGALREKVVLTISYLEKIVEGDI
jgi:hypothetical protein